MVRGTEVEQWRRTPGEGRYARTELERRFLVVGLPEGLRAPRRIEDRYLDGTRLRLRHVRVGEESVFKLTQKVRREAGDPAEVAITNIYLTAAEHARLAALPGATLTKTRRVWGQEGFVVDELHGRLAGLWLLEIEVAELGAPLALPGWAGREVSHDERFAGGNLAHASVAQVAALLADPA